MSQALKRPYSEIVGMSGLEAYALDAAVIRWGTAFQSALEQAGAGAKTQQQAEQKQQTTIRRWIPSTRKYR